LIQVRNEITSALQVTGNNEMDYSAYFHSIKNYKLKFWGNSSNGATIIKGEKKKIKLKLLQAAEVQTCVRIYLKV
jgi:hypothetical protein